MTYLPKKYKITEIKTINPEVKLFRVKADLNPLPGQFIEVSIPGVGECPLASCSYNEKYIDMLTRMAGNVTTQMFKLKKNDYLFIRGPYGNGFAIDELRGKDLIMVAGGTGLAPITSLIDYIEQNRKDFGKILIYFGFRNKDYILLKDRIAKWEKKFNVIVCLDDAGGTCYKKGFINEQIKSQRHEIGNTIALMCGPEIMMKSVTEALNSQGLSNDKIYWSMERRMECGMGSCGRCLLADVYVCKDGPVFRYDIIKPKLENEEGSNTYKGN